MVLLIGGGSVAARKAAMLIRAGALLRIVAPEISAEMSELADRAEAEVHQRPYKASDLSSASLVVAATDSYWYSRAGGRRRYRVYHLLPSL